MSDHGRESTIGRSVWAVVLGMLVGFVLTIGTDVALHWAGVFPPLGQPSSNGPLTLATGYRIVFNVIACYVVARLAPARPMAHALVAGAIGFLFGAVGAAVTWSRAAEFGPHWYPIAVALIALPCAWIGGKLREAQLQRRPA